MDYSKQVPAAERTLNILEALGAEPDGLTAGDLLEQLDMSRSALFALLNTLKARHYIEQVDQRGRYQLGPALWTLAPGRQDALGELVRAFLNDQELKQPSETVALLWLDGETTVVLAQHEAQQQVRAVLQPGARHPAPKSAAGIALLAGEPAQDGAGVNEQGAGAEQFAVIRQQGYARLETDETVEIACPVCADGVQPVAALQVAIPRFRHTDSLEESILYEAGQAAARLSYRLGAPVYQPYGWSVGEPLGPNRALSPDEIERFLQGPWSARLACVRADGTPHVLPLWYEWDGQFVWLAASPGAQWKEVVRESQRVSLTIDEPWPPLRRAFIVGRAERVAQDQAPGGLQGLRRRLAVRYLGRGASQREELCRTEGWDVVRVTPERISGQQGLGRP